MIRKDVETQHPGILIVDDEPPVAWGYRDMIKNAGFTDTRCSHNVKEAIRSVEKRAPDIIFMDIMLKGDIDGVQAASVIQGKYDIPVVYLTAHSDDETVDKVMRGGDMEVYGYLLKTQVSPAELQIAIKKGIYNHRLHRENNRDLVYSVDKAGKLTALNRAAEKVIGCEASEAKGMKFQTLVSPDHSSIARQNLVKNIEHGEATIYELVVRSRNGETKSTLIVKAQPLVLGKEPMGVRHVARLITKRNEKEARQLELYNRFFGDNDTLETLDAYRGEVVEIGPEGYKEAARVHLTSEMGHVCDRYFPTLRLEKENAAFTSAKIAYEMFRVGATNVSKLSYTGPSREELLAKGPEILSDEIVKEFDQ